MNLCTLYSEKDIAELTNSLESLKLKEKINNKENEEFNNKKFSNKLKTEKEKGKYSKRKKQSSILEIIDYPSIPNSRKNAENHIREISNMTNKIGLYLIFEIV